MAWVVWCVPAGALAGVGLIEFNWGGPPYDGGFAGELALFGGCLAFGQAPFVALFVAAMHGRVAGGRAGYVAAILAAVSWPLMGLLGWTLGSYFEVGLATPLYSDLSILVGVLPWLVVGVLEATLLTAALAPLGGSRDVVVSGIAWVLASAVGGLLYEYWSSFDIAAGRNRIKDAIGTYLGRLGVAENVAFEVATAALFLPLLYGLPTGLALIVIHRLVRRGSPAATVPGPYS